MKFLATDLSLIEKRKAIIDKKLGVVAWTIQKGF
jgi:hypothetical protein